MKRSNPPTTPPNPPAANPRESPGSARRARAASSRFGRASFRARRPMSPPMLKPPNPRAPSRKLLWLCRKLPQPRRKPPRALQKPSWPQRGAPKPMCPQPAQPLRMLQAKQPRMTPRSLPRARQAKPMVPSNEGRQCPRKTMGWNRLQRQPIPKRTHLPRQAMRG